MEKGKAKAYEEFVQRGSLDTQQGWTERKRLAELLTNEKKR